MQRTGSEVRYCLNFRCRSNWLKKAAAWLAWPLENQLKGDLERVGKLSWFAPGWVHYELLPWVQSRRAYERRPRCSVDRDWMRLARRKLREFIATVQDETLAEFTFDGQILRILLENKVIAVQARGNAWSDSVVLKVTDLRNLPERFTSESVGISFREGFLAIGSNRYLNLPHKAQEEIRDQPT